jgi:hypothetical protein
MLDQVGHGDQIFWIKARRRKDPGYSTHFDAAFFPMSSRTDVPTEAGPAISHSAALTN